MRDRHTAFGRNPVFAFSLLVVATCPAANQAAEPGPWRESRSKLSGPGNVTALALSPDGDRIAVCALNHAEVRDQHLVMLCSLAEDRNGFVKLGAHDGEIRAAAFSPDGSILATTGDDRTVKLWDMRGENDVQSVPIGCAGFGVAFTPDGERLIAAGFSLSVWSLSDLQRVAFVDDVLVSGVAVSPDGAFLATGELPPNTRSRVVRLRSPETGEVLRTFDETQSAIIRSVVFSPDGRRLAAGSADGTALVWDVASGKLVASCTPGMGPITSVAFSPDGSLIAIGNQDRPVQLWSTESGRQRFSLSGGTGRCAAFLADGATLVTSGNGSSTNDSALPLPGRRERQERVEIKVWRFVE